MTNSGTWDNQDARLGTAEAMRAEKFANIFESNPAAMAVSVEGRFTDVNAAFLHKLGFSREEVIGRTVAELGFIVDNERYQAAVEQLLAGGQLQNLELRIKCKDGQVLNGLFFGECLEQQGKPGMLTVLVDVTAVTLLTPQEAAACRRLENIIQGIGLGVWEWVVQTGELSLNAQWAAMLGYTLEELQPASMATWQQLLHPDDRAEMEEAMQDCLQGARDSYECTCRMRHKDGQWRWIHSRGRVMRDLTGAAYRWLGINTDSTVEKEKSEELGRFFSVNLDLLCIASLEGEFIKINNSWTETLGYSIEELKSKRFFEFIHPDDLSKTQQAMETLQQQQVVGLVNRYRCKNGCYRYIEWRSQPAGNLIYAAARDITEHIETTNKIRELSMRDPLTNIYNRRYIYERLECINAEYIREDSVYSVSILDIDRFKRINDHYGHQAGDFILKEFTRIISRNMRVYDLLGRFGGEEFIIVSINSSKEQTLSIVERMLEIIRNEVFVYNGIKIKYTFSAGIADSSEYGKDVLAIEKIIEKADSRLYIAKSTGRNQIVFDKQTVPGKQG